MSPPRTQLAAAALVVAGALLPGGASAQGLSLEEALRRADRHNEVPGIAAARVAQARAARRASYAGLLPVLAASGTYRRRAREVVREVSGTEVVISRHDALSAAARLELAILDATAFPRIAAAGHAVEAAEHDARNARRMLWFEVAEGFFAVLAAERIAEAAAERVSVSEMEARAATRRLEVGLADRNVVSRAELELAAARLEGVQSRNAVDQARLSLEFLIGTEIPDTLVEPEGPVVQHLPRDRMVARAIALRDDVRTLRSEIAAADALEDEPWLRLVPRIDGNAVTTWTNEAGFSGNDTDWTIAVTATWVLYDGGLRYAHAAARSAELEALSLALGSLERRVRLEVRSALADLAAATAAVEVAESRVVAANRNLEEVRARFERGLADALTMADASEQAFLAAAGLAGQRLASRLAELALLRATGRWPDGREAR